MNEIGTLGAEGRVDEAVRERFFSDARHGVLVEVGAAHPEYLSVSALFRRAGWTIVAIEPNPEFCELHRARGHQVLQYACGDHDEDDVDFSIVDSRGAAYEGGHVSYESFSSLAIKNEYADLVDSELAVRKIKVDLRRLDTLLEENLPEIDLIDILAVDVEGWELEVLNGLDIRRFRPRVLIVENLLDAGSYRRYMQSRGYALWRHIKPNDVYVARSELRLDDRIRGPLSLLSRRGRQLRASLTARARG